MTHSRPTALLLTLALSWFFCENARGQQVAIPSTVKPPVLYLCRANSGQHVAATVGQPIEITLQTIGPGQYDTPQISCLAIRFEGFKEPRCQNAGGPTQIYRFRAAAEGAAQVQIPHTAFARSPMSIGRASSSAFRDLTPTFEVTIQVGSAAGCPSTLHPSMMLDQANTAAWRKEWTNLVNDVRQAFTPSLPRLAAVEVQLVVANPGPSGDTVTMTLLDPGGESLAAKSKTVAVADCDRVLFDLGGLEVSPGKVYSIRLSDGTTFGWKYVVGGYEKGVASFNGKPLVRNTRSTFLFRTFGSN